MAKTNAEIWNFPNSKIAQTEPPVTAGMPTRAWQDWFQQITTICYAGTLRGTTGERPTVRALASDPPSANLWIGRTYFDTTLGKPIWVKTLSPLVWVDASGASV